MFLPVDPAPVPTLIDEATRKSIRRYQVISIDLDGVKFFTIFTIF